MLAVSPRPTLISQLLLGQISLPLMTRLFNMVGGHPSTDSHLSQLQFRSRNMQITNNLEIYLETHAPSNFGLDLQHNKKNMPFKTVLIEFPNLQPVAMLHWLSSFLEAPKEQWHRWETGFVPFSGEHVQHMHVKF
jgi:hypothetical protein